MNLRKTALLVALATGIHAPVYAMEARPGYAGLTLGQATVDDFCDGSESSCDDSAVSFRVHGGTELNNFVNLEFGY